jgi:hypothetical protein
MSASGGAGGSMLDKAAYAGAFIVGRTLKGGRGDYKIIFTMDPQVEALAAISDLLSAHFTAAGHSTWIASAVGPGYVFSSKHIEIINNGKKQSDIYVQAEGVVAGRYVIIIPADIVSLLDAKSRAEGTDALTTKLLAEPFKSRWNIYIAGLIEGAQGGGYRRRGSRASRKSGRKSRKSKRRSSKKRSSRRSRN